jgi:Tat protein translocase TatB subunit
VFLLILESLGSTELLFILAMALIFFGPRKLPQLSRSLGKSMAEFRKASEDFKRTWDREANLEEFNILAPGTQSSEVVTETSTLPATNTENVMQAPMIQAVAPDRVIARNFSGSEEIRPAVVENPEAVTSQPEPSRKRDWL